MAIMPAVDLFDCNNRYPDGKFCDVKMLERSYVLTSSFVFSEFFVRCVLPTLRFQQILRGENGAGRED